MDDLKQCYSNVDNFIKSLSDVVILNSLQHFQKDQSRIEREVNQQCDSLSSLITSYFCFYL
jgi:hypothetical protein